MAWVRGARNQIASASALQDLIFKAPTCPAFSPTSAPTSSPNHVLPKSSSCSSLFYHFSVDRSLILSQKRDVEKDATVSHESTSRPGSDHSLEVLDLSTKLQNPLAGKDRATLEADAVSFCEKHGLMEYGALWFC